MRPCLQDSAVTLLPTNLRQDPPWRAASSVANLRLLRPKNERRTARTVSGYGVSGWVPQAARCASGPRVSRVLPVPFTFIV